MNAKTVLKLLSSVFGARSRSRNWWYSLCIVNVFGRCFRLTSQKNSGFRMQSSFAENVLEILNGNWMKNQNHNRHKLESTDIGREREGERKKGSQSRALSEQTEHNENSTDSIWRAIHLKSPSKTKILSTKTKEKKLKNAKLCKKYWIVSSFYKSLHFAGQM